MENLEANEKTAAAEPPKVEGPKELVIQQKVYDMILYGYPALEQFPKSQKFSLAQDIKKCMDHIMRLVVTANKKYTKKTTLQELDVEVATLKIYIRMARDLRYLPTKKYDTWAVKITEVGRILGGWIKAANNRPPMAGEKKGEAETVVEYTCSECGAKITKKIKDYSELHYKAALCYKCQGSRHKAQG